MTPHLRRIGWTLAGAGLAAILMATLTPAPGDPVGSRVCLICGAMGGVDAILNVLLFVPFGAGLALAGVRFRWAILVVILLSACVETAQLFIPGRDTSLGDLATNTIGGVLAYTLVRSAGVWLRPPPRFAAALGISWSAVWLVIQAVTSFALAASFPVSTYYGQIAPELGNYERFRGRVIAASIERARVTDTQLSTSDSAASRLRAGATVSASVVAEKPTPDIAPIVRIADDEGDEIVLLGQAGRSEVFRVATGADILRLRPPVFALRGGFPASDQSVGTDTAIVTGRYGRGAVTLTAKRKDFAAAREVALAPSLGWTLLLPFQWLIEGSAMEMVASFLWMLVLLIPVGFWLEWAIVDRGARRRARVVSVSLGVLVVVSLGLAWLPAAFGVANASVLDWAAALTGLTLGALLARAFAKWPNPARL